MHADCRSVEYELRIERTMCLVYSVARSRLLNPSMVVFAREDGEKDRG